MAISTTGISTFVDQISISSISFPNFICGVSLSFFLLHLNRVCSLILVDSTRSGKRIPDALSKTVPIWCAVLNRALLIRYPDLEKHAWDIKLYTPPAVVSMQEHDQIEQRLDGWAEALAVNLSCTLQVQLIFNRHTRHLRLVSLNYLALSDQSGLRQPLELFQNYVLTLQQQVTSFQLFASLPPNEWSRE